MKRTTVLLADDHQLVAEGLQRILESEFDIVGIANDGFALIQAVRDGSADVIICDISMPGLNGLDALEELRKEHPNIKVVMLSMHHNVNYAQQALEAGALGYVLKASAPEELILAVRAAAMGRTFISSHIAGEVLQAMRRGEAAQASPIDRLSLRQREILRLLVDGHSAKKIASQLGISPRTVEFHKYTMMESIGVSSSAELIRAALQSGIIDT